MIRIDTGLTKTKITASVWQPNTYLFVYKDRWELIIFQKNSDAQKYLEENIGVAWQLVSENIA